MYTQSNQELLLHDQVNRIRKHKAGRYGVVIQLSKLRPYHKREHHIQLVINSLDKLKQNFEGSLFQTEGHDIFLIIKNPRESEIYECFNKIKVLFRQDPLIINEKLLGESFCLLYDLEKDYNKFLNLSMKCKEEFEENQKNNAQKPHKKNVKTPIKPSDVDLLEKTLNNADISDFLRRQSICALDSHRNITKIYDKIFVSSFDLNNMILPNVDITTEKTLFRYLTKIFDKRVLALITKYGEEIMEENISLSFNLSTLSSMNFLEFDKNLRNNIRGTVIIEIDLSDIVSDFPNYMFIKNFLKERGYRICIGNIAPQYVSFLDRKEMGFDLFKLTYSAEVCDPLSKEQKEKIAENISKIQSSRCILSCCETDDAFKFGSDLSISLFQGFYVDRLLAAQNEHSKTLTMKEALAKGKDKKSQ